MVFETTFYQEPSEKSIGLSICKGVLQRKCMTFQRAESTATSFSRHIKLLISANGNTHICITNFNITSEVQIEHWITLIIKGKPANFTLFFNWKFLYATIWMECLMWTLLKIVQFSISVNTLAVSILKEFPGRMLTKQKWWDCGAEGILRAAVEDVGSVCSVYLWQV